MSGTENLLAQPATQALGWALLHFVWQGFAVAALYGLARLFMRRKSANARYAVACGAMLTMLVLAASTFTLLYEAMPKATPAGVFDHAEPSAAPLADAALAPMPSIAHGTDFASSMRAWSRQWVEPALPSLTAIWLVGVVLLSLRFIGGLVVAQRLKRRFTRPADAEWQALVDRLCVRIGVTRAVRLCESAIAEVPTAIGWLSPVILVPAGMLAGLSPAQVEAVLAHELSHIRRCDYLVNIVQSMVETLLFYHPAVWWISRQIRDERENCCDDMAVVACGDVVAYARALAQLDDMRGAIPVGALAATGGSLVKRIERLLGKPSSAHYAPAYLAGVLAIVTVGSLWVGARAAEAPAKIVAAIAAVGLAPSEAARDEQTPATEPARSQTAAAVPAEEEVEEVEEADDFEEPEEVQEPEQADEPEEPEEPEQEDGPDYIDGLAAAGLSGLSVDQLIALRNAGVTPSYIQGLAAAGYTKLTVEQLMAMGVQGVGPTYVRELRDAGYSGLSPDDLIAMRVQGVSAAYVRELASLGFTKLSSEQLVALAVQGVRASYVKELQDAGYSNLSLDTVLALRVQGVSASYVRAMAEAGFPKLSLDDLLAMRVQGVSPTYVRDLASLGYSNLSADQVVALRVQGVSSNYIREIRGLGYSPTLEEFLNMRVQGVTAAYIRGLKERGFDKLTIEQIVRLRIAGIR